MRSRFAQARHNLALDWELKSRVRQQMREGVKRVNGDNMYMVTSTTINAPIEKVYEAFTDLNLAAILYAPVGVIHLKDSPNPDDRFGVGSERALSPFPGFSYVEEITDKEPLKLLGWRHVRGGAIKRLAGKMEFEALSDTRTLMTETVDIDTTIPAIARIMCQGVWFTNITAFVRSATLIEREPDLLGSAVPLLKEK